MNETENIPLSPVCSPNSVNRLDGDQIPGFLRLQQHWHMGRFVFPKNHGGQTCFLFLRFPSLYSTSDAHGKASSGFCILKTLGRPQMAESHVLDSFFIHHFFLNLRQ